MDLDKISTVVRPRASWQAVDLGFRMAAQWFVPLAKGYLFLTLPIFVLIVLLIPNDYKVWGAIAFWWCKPWWERILLAYLSVRQFGETPDTRTLFKQWLNVAFRQLLPTLLWRRLSPVRSYTMAVTQLEALSGSKRQKRLTQFSGDNHQAALWLTIVGMHIEALIATALFALVILLLPVEFRNDPEFFNFLMESEFAVNLAGYIAMVAVAPFYVAAGFSLYLNQRTQLEGWDIEITFKRLVEHRQRKKRRSSQSMALTGILCCLLLLPSQPMEATAAEATTAKPESTEQLKIREQAKEIISEAPFTRFETKTYPEFYLDYTPEPDADDDKAQTTQLQWLASLLSFLADSIQWLIAALIAGLIIMLVIRYRHVLRALTTGEGTQNTTQNKPNALFDLDISADSIPADPAAAATALLKQGKTREAMSLLYRCALYDLVHNQHLEIDDSFTEGQCLAAVKQNTATATAEYFARLTGHWQRLAYAGLLLTEDELNQLVDDFNPVFKESGNV